MTMRLSSWKGTVHCIWRPILVWAMTNCCGVVGCSRDLAGYCAAVKTDVGDCVGKCDESRGGTGMIQYSKVVEVRIPSLDSLRWSRQYQAVPRSWSIARLSGS